MKKTLWLKLLLLSSTVFLGGGCCLFGRTVYVNPKQNVVLLVPRPAISRNPTTVEQLRKDRSDLKRAIIAWEAVVLNRNRTINEANAANGFTVDPDSTKIVTVDYSTLAPDALTPEKLKPKPKEPIPDAE